jgi:hypothetical protein
VDGFDLGAALSARRGVTTVTRSVGSMKRAVGSMKGAVGSMKRAVGSMNGAVAPVRRTRRRPPRGRGRGFVAVVLLWSNALRGLE